jgi:hypothetical protein
MGFDGTAWVRNWTLPRFVGATGKTVALGALAFGTLSCAKFPAGGGTSQGTQINFTITMAGPLNPNYIYIVAIYASNLVNPASQLPLGGPQPVYGIGSANGFMAGEATTYIVLNPALGSQMYTVYQVGDPTDAGTTQNTPIGYPVNYINPNPTIPGGQYGSQWGFQISSSLLASSVATADQLQSMTFNILTMNKTTLGGTSGRLIDALGNTATMQNLPQTVQLNTSSTTTNASLGSIEPSNDEYGGGYDPALDITDFSVQVSPA